MCVGLAHIKVSALLLHGASFPEPFLNIRALQNCKACCSGNLLDSDMSVQFDVAAGASG